MTIKSLAPNILKVPLRNTRDLILDAVSLLPFTRGMFVPPRHLQRLVGDGDFQHVGDGLLQLLIEYTSLKPSESILDVGCGIGRVAAPLTCYLSPQGSYHGFDIMPLTIKWCQQKITPKYPNFRFQLADIRSVHYNPRGRYNAAEYHFPYAANTFDVVFLTSVFTHLLPDDVQHYLLEIARVLKPGGRCMATAFLLNDVALRSIEEGHAIFTLQHIVPGGRISNSEDPEAVVAHEEASFLEACRNSGLRISTLHRGSWSGDRSHAQGHDFVVMRKLPVV